MKRIAHFLTPEVVFHLMVIFSVATLLPFKYIPSVDGPQHLYNANVIVQLLKGNELFHQFFNLNDVLVGYWTGHFWLSFFHLFLPGFLAEKITIILYISAMAYTFRYAITAHKKSLSFAALLIFPFIFSLYFANGYYSFVFAAIFFFLWFGYYMRYKNQLTLRHIFVLLLILLGLFLSHAFAFALVATIVFVYWSSDLLISALQQQPNYFRKSIKKASYLAIIFLPALILWAIYINHVLDISADVRIRNTFFSHIFNIIFIRPAIAYNVSAEQFYVWCYGVAILTLSGYLFYQFINHLKKKQIKITINHKHIWLVIFIVLCVMYYFFPDKISAGSLKNRVGLYMFFALIVWLNLFKYPKWIEYWVLVVVAIAFGLHRVYQLKTTTTLNKDVQTIEFVKEHIESNSILLPLAEWDNYIHRHFLCYLGIDRPVINLGNPQADGRFPIVWDYKNMPRLQTGDQLYKHQYKTLQKNNNQDTMTIDYIAIFNYQLFRNGEQFTHWQPLLNQYYDSIAASQNKKCILYRIKAEKASTIKKP